MSSGQNRAGSRFVVVAAVAGGDEMNSSTFIAESAARMAASVTGGELHLIHVLHDYQPRPVGIMPNPWSGMEILRIGREYLDDLTKHAATLFSGRIVGHLANGEPWREIVQCAEYLMADLVVVGSHGRAGILRLALGSVSDKVVQKSRCPVLVARPKSYDLSETPEIEPACADCLAKQAETGGEFLWCAQHATHHPVAHLYYEFPQSFAVGSELLRPE